MDFIKTEMRGRVGTIAFNHYCKRNALGRPLIRECLNALANFEIEGRGAKGLVGWPRRRRIARSQS